ncbi:MAG TPA: hypothetical protein PKJ96_11995 [Thiobacillaceae bacterium]|nr:hypothetical protein [Thiobacillaceae bacterium]
MNVAVLLAGWAGSRWLGSANPLQTFNADKIRLLRDVRPMQAGEAETGGPSAAQTPPAGGNCRIWKDGLDAAGVAQVEAYLRRDGVGARDYDLVLSTRQGWWVFIPPMASMAAVQAVMDDARARGIQDMSPIRGGPLANALALGTFSSLDGARRHAAEMEQKGLQGVRYAPRPGVGAVRLEIVRESPAMHRALAGPWPPGLVPQDCPARR